MCGLVSARQNQGTYTNYYGITYTNHHGVFYTYTYTSSAKDGIAYSN